MLESPTSCVVSFSLSVFLSLGKRYPTHGSKLDQGPLCLKAADQMICHTQTHIHKHAPTDECTDRVQNLI